MGKQTERAEQDPDRAARLEKVRAQQRTQDRRRTLIWVGAIGAVVVVLAAAVTWAVLGSASSRTLTGLVTYPGLSRDHVEGKVSYAQTPPVGGKHSAVWQNCGVYTTPIANENAVHSMEHGAMWITYRPDLPADQVTILQDAVRGQHYGLLSPYPGVPTPVVATVWGTQLTLPSATDPRLKLFLTTYASGALAPEPGGECTGGTGTPQP